MEDIKNTTELLLQDSEITLTLGSEYRENYTYQEKNNIINKGNIDSSLNSELNTDGS